MQTILGHIGKFWIIWIVFDNFWLVWTILDQFWPFWTICWLCWTILDCYGPCWTISANFRPFWTILVHIIPLWTILTLFYTNLVYFGIFFYYYDSFDHFELFRFILNYLDPCGTIFVFSLEKCYLREIQLSVMRHM